MKFRNLIASAALAAVSTGALATTQAFFEIDGDTFSAPFTLTNQSTAGEMITRFQLFLAPAGLVFDTVTGGVPNESAGRAFAADGGTGTNTGWNQVAVLDGISFIDLSFTDFDAGGPLGNGGAAESFVFRTDIDSADGLRDQIWGNELAGTPNAANTAAVVWVDFSNGERLLGTMNLIPGGSAVASRFVQTGSCVIASNCGGTTPPPTGVPEPGTLALGGLALLALGAARKRRA